ncbi:polymorphic toxin type 17 domain-containing protein [Vibrio cholerae]|uniref:polymorphic toxin type 17 domain-containing protein n=1 Tax=Vibrio cholerae TaxID=666 RepID=UPI0006160B72|nr:polymorphic toxin type 17 domain-containing protein [Vibrio cholerae]AKB05077.1 toxin 45 family protein [Vibrio cholerae]GHZ02665.1 toxin 45 family protein [Vibrio cholerae]
MVRVTICPHFLVELPKNVTPTYIETNYIAPLIANVQEAKKQQIDICLSSELVELYNNSFPWDKMADSSWTGYLIDWSNGIRSELLSYAKISSVPKTSTGNVICNLLSIQVNELFEALLLKLGSGGMPSGMHPEGVISTQNCGSTGILSLFQLVQSKSDFEKVSFPWLRIYNQPLPTCGAFPFVPPKNWALSTSPIRGNRFSNNGYVDHVGNEWEWDKLHKDHWNVQHSAKTNDYTNVNVDGSKR